MCDLPTPDRPTSSTFSLRSTNLQVARSMIFDFWIFGLKCKSSSERALSNARAEAAHRAACCRDARPRRTEGGARTRRARGRRRPLAACAAQGRVRGDHEVCHVGIFRRGGKARLPIEELRGSRPVDALLHQGEAQGVADRGGESFAVTFKRVLPLEVGK
jgi:hypothetical protein